MGQEEERDGGVCVCADADLCGLLRPGFMLPQTCREKTLALLQRTCWRKKKRVSKDAADSSLDILFDDLLPVDGSTIKKINKYY